jgi:hypothetical protein
MSFRLFNSPSIARTLDYLVYMLRDGSRDAHKSLAGIAAVRPVGLLAMNVRCDFGLCDGGWTFAITDYWQEPDAYQVYDTEEEHNRLRREIFAVSARIPAQSPSRVIFRPLGDDM